MYHRFPPEEPNVHASCVRVSVHVRKRFLNDTVNGRFGRRPSRNFFAVAMERCRKAAAAAVSGYKLLQGLLKPVIFQNRRVRDVSNCPYLALNVGDELLQLLNRWLCRFTSTQALEMAESEGHADKCLLDGIVQFAGHPATFLPLHLDQGRSKALTQPAKLDQLRYVIACYGCERFAGD